MIHTNLIIFSFVAAAAMAVFTALRFRLLGPANHRPSKINGVLFPLFAFVATFFAISSVEYFSNYQNKTITMWEELFAVATSAEFAHGPDSVRGRMQHVDSGRILALYIHAITGSIMLVLGIFQFWGQFRQKHPKTHRRMGQAYILLSIPTAGGAAYYLMNSGTNDVFSGQQFYATLAGLAVATIFSTFMAYITARQKRFEAHRAWMLLSYFCILSAPILRAAWIMLYQVFGELTHWDNNLYALAPSIALVAIGPLFVFGIAQRRSAR